MEKILYFDCFAGISGDMTLGALIDLGLDPEAVIKELQKLDVKKCDIKVKKINRYAISGTDVDVVLTEECETERNLEDVRRIIQTSAISKRSKTLSIEIFTEIAYAEAAVHGKRIEEVHFHEVGAMDSIVDIVGAAICIDMLKVDEIFCSPVHDGHGFIFCRHGRLPVPVPAVVKMLEGSGISIVTEDVQAELVTPTGFGILKTVAKRCGAMPEMLVERVGYGFGKTDTGRLNALRIMMGTTDFQTLQ